MYMSLYLIEIFFISSYVSKLMRYLSVSVQTNFNFVLLLLTSAAEWLISA